MPETTDLFLVFLKPLNKSGIPYMVTGSAASIAYGEPRLTLDIDLVVEISGNQANRLPVVFPAGEFYCPPAPVIIAEVERPLRGHFNVIHMESGFKADFYPVGEDLLHRWGMARRRKFDFDGEPIMLAPPEYVIIRKLEFFQEGGSDKHLRDIRGMLEVSGDLINRQELEELIQQRNLRREWSRVQETR